MSTVGLMQVGCAQGTSVQQRTSQNNEAPSKEQSAQIVNQKNTRLMSGEDHWIKRNFLRDETKYEEGAKEYQLALDNGFDTNLVHTETGILLDYYLNRPEEAIRHFRVVIDRDPKDGARIGL